MFDGNIIRYYRPAIFVYKRVYAHYPTFFPGCDFYSMVSYKPIAFFITEYRIKNRILY
ncbi:MAG: hypothetical protein JWR05_190 [Mucilaginibacter sp.]|nr:hypothetical protein [Mucilaginibacter sp.]